MCVDGCGCVTSSLYIRLSHSQHVCCTSGHVVVIFHVGSSNVIFSRFGCYKVTSKVSCDKLTVACNDLGRYKDTFVRVWRTQKLTTVQLLILNHVVITLSLQHVRVSSQINQHQQMLTAASRTSCERQAENPLAQSCPLLTQVMW